MIEVSPLTALLCAAFVAGASTAVLVLISAAQRGVRAGDWS